MKSTTFTFFTFRREFRPEICCVPNISFQTFHLKPEPIFFSSVAYSMQPPNFFCFLDFECRSIEIWTVTDAMIRIRIFLLHRMHNLASSDLNLMFTSAAKAVESRTALLYMLFPSFLLEHTYISHMRQRNECIFYQEKICFICNLSQIIFKRLTQAFQKEVLQHFVNIIRSHGSEKKNVFQETRSLSDSGLSEAYRTPNE